MAAKATTRAAPAQAPAKSMRQLNKENEDLQAQVDQLTSSLQSVHAGFCRQPSKSQLMREAYRLYTLAFRWIKV